MSEPWFKPWLLQSCLFILLCPHCHLLLWSLLSHLWRLLFWCNPHIVFCPLTKSVPHPERWVRPSQLFNYSQKASWESLETIPSVISVNELWLLLIHAVENMGAQRARSLVSPHQNWYIILSYYAQFSNYEQRARRVQLNQQLQG